jgi:hypothetical protein
MKRFLLSLILTSAGYSATISQQGTTTTANPEYPSAFTNYLINSVIPQFEAAELAPGLTDLEISYLKGEVDGTIAQVNLVGQSATWMTDFGAKSALEQAKMQSEEQQIFIFSLFGGDPTTVEYQYNQGYEDAVQNTINLMNSWPGTGGTVAGTTEEYVLVIPDGFGASSSTSTTASSTPAPATTPPTSTKAPTVTKESTVVVDMPVVISTVANANRGPAPVRNGVLRQALR